LASPAQEALIPTLVRASELAPAIALNAVPPTLARTIGPAMGAVMAATMGPAAAFALASCSNFLFVLIIWRIEIHSHPVHGDSNAAQGAIIHPGVRAGFRHLFQDLGLLRLLIGVIAIGVGADPVTTLTPSLAENFGRGAGTVGAFASAFGIGSLLMFVILGTLRRRFSLSKLGTAGLLMLASGLVAAGHAPTLLLVTGAFVVAGAGMTTGLTTLTTQLQQRVPNELRGRIMALWAVAFLGSRPIAAAVDGAMADALGASSAFTFAGIVVGVLAWCSSHTARMRRPSA
jgi:predicted MFS family arabinose efflux permease